MKTKSILILMLCTVPFIGCSAQKVKKDKKSQQQEQVKVQEPVVEEEVPEITEECMVNVSLFNESVKNKLFADAVDPWYQVYNNCPNANKAIYSQGPKIISWQMSQAKTEEEKHQLKELLMQLYDKRIKYFGNDPKYPVPYILGEKAMDYCEYFTEDPTKERAYGWLKQSVEGMGVQSKLTVISKFAEVSNGLYKSNPDKYGEQYIADYQKVSDLLAQIGADANNKNAATANQYKDFIDNVFAVSGAADCSKLDEIYAKAVADNKENLDMLQKIMKLYRRVSCIESDVYFSAAEFSHKLQPTSESAAGCAAMSAKKGDYRAAVAYYDQAFQLAEEEEDKANYLYNNAVYYYSQLKDFPTARQYARRSLDINPNQGRCYMLIGLMYAESKPYGDDAKGRILNKTVFWAAVDKFVKAKTVDPSITDEANKFIQSYSKYFPTKEECFDLPQELGGQTFTIAGWIGETTVCRPK